MTPDTHGETTQRVPSPLSDPGGASREERFARILSPEGAAR